MKNMAQREPYDISEKWESDFYSTKLPVFFKELDFNSHFLYRYTEALRHFTRHVKMLLEEDYTTPSFRTHKESLETIRGIIKERCQEVLAQILRMMILLTECRKDRRRSLIFVKGSKEILRM